jgi:hypothetical protein
VLGANTSRFRGRRRGPVRRRASSARFRLSRLPITTGRGLHIDVHDRPGESGAAARAQAGRRAMVRPDQTAVVADAVG